MSIIFTLKVSCYSRLNSRIKLSRIPTIIVRTAAPRKQYYEKSQPGWVGFWFSFKIFIMFLPLHIHPNDLPSAPVRLTFRPCRGKLQLIEPLKIMGQLMGQGIED